MNKSFKLLPPTMPNYIFYESGPKARQAGFNADSNKIHISDLSAEEAIAYGELMKEEFVKHWNKFKAQGTNEKQ